MGRFKVGDRSRVVYVRNRGTKEWRPNVVVTVASTAGGVTPSTGRTFDCVVEHPGGKAYVLFDQLEPITDQPAELGSWEEIERTVGWKPGVTV